MAKDKTTQKRSTLADVVTREYTIHLHKHVFGRSLRKRAPAAVKAVKDFAEKAMGTKDVRLDPSLNKALWSRGVKHVNHRIRVRISRKRNDDEEAKEKLYSYVTYVPVTDFKGLQNEVVEDEN
ncbi:ribosomal protein L31e-domain-containing protein [Mycotypha africana]|uniref:ribosomal protein L31e-domain-containing protein n=1 Tax=Mycotypha africana TaxID=64632 RepID=UPI0023004108|nr:ribosomal protein L31e-domain-containing protein [Mycotypha africana]KAI8984516.1 ribosomal protein L31e-domain-containing protein [Mycotypha africana]